MDLWRRIDAPNEEFFLPHDFEVSLEELSSICNKAKAWRGAGGTTRKLVISDYLERDPYDPRFQQHTKHYAVYEQEMSGRRSLYRHFLMLNDGSIIEIFEEFSVDLTQQVKALNKLLGSPADVPKVTAEGEGEEENVVKKSIDAHRKLNIFSGLNLA